jgi:hypothetical protein
VGRLMKSVPGKTAPLTWRAAVTAIWLRPVGGGRSGRLKRPTPTSKPARLILPVIAAAAVTAVLTTAPAGAANLTGASTSSLICGLSQRADQVSSGGVHVISRANAFDTSGQQLCIQPAPGDAPGFTVVSNLRYTGLWQAYPFTGTGCAYNLCTAGTDLPRLVSALPRAANTSFSWRGASAPGYWNAAYDIWFGKTNQVSTQDNGAELMIWLRTPARYHGGQLVRIGHRDYWFIWWRGCNQSKICWNYLQFRTTRTVAGVRDLWLRPFLTYLEDRGLLRSSWYLTSVHAGFELVSGGKGLQVTWFNAHT